MSGSGTLNPIEQGKPRASSIERIMVPKAGLSAPRSAANGQLIRALGHLAALHQPQRNAGSAAARPGVTRISASLGEVRLNFHNVTHGLARGSASAPGSARSAANKDTVWSSSEARASTGGGNGSGQGNSNDAGGSSNAAAGMGATTSGMTAAAAAGTGNSSGNGNANANGNGNGANGNGNANANGNGNGNANGNGNDNGNGNGNGNRNGNGNGNGNGKKS